MGTMRPAAENWSCGYEPEPKNWVCAKPATWHGFRLTEDGKEIASMMASCDDHLIDMGKRTDYRHPMKSACGLPGSRFKWPENECYLDFDPNVLLAHGYPCDDEQCQRCPVIRRQ